MLEEGDVDEDYFNPALASNASLANIFQTKGNTDDHIQNSSLKYVAPKPNSTKPDESRASECIFACPLMGYEWYNNVYSPKGKIGFAIMKIIKIGIHNILMYDANKSTLSCTTISPNLEVKLKENVYISFYDNARKYWSVYGTPENINKVIEILSNLEVKIIPSLDNNPPPEPAKSPKTDDIFDKESDADSSVNRKTEASILSRMASMGQAILPPLFMPKEKTSDSSDSNEDILESKNVRHKLAKNISKKISQERINNTKKVPAAVETHSNEKLDIIKPISSLRDGQMTMHSDVNKSNILPNELHTMMCEHQMNNREMRINIGRITDKVDMVLDKISDLKHSSTSEDANFTTDIYKKLLREYENKICNYEEIIKSSQSAEDNSTGQHRTIESIDTQHSCDSEIEKLQIEITVLKKDVDDKEIKICNLLKQVEELNAKLQENNEVNASNLKTDNLLKLKQEENNIYENTASIAAIKEIMNDTFQTVSDNIDDSASYSGSTVKNLLASIIKKRTLEILDKN